MLTKVADVMTSAPVAVTAGTEFKTIATLLAASPFAAVPVIDESRHVIGIVTESDLLLKEGHPGAADEHHVLEGRRRRRELEKAAGIYARDVMSTPAHTIGAVAGISEAARLMHHLRINQLPVVDEEKVLIGIVSRGDLLKTFLRSDSEITNEVREEILVRTLWWAPNAIDITVTSGVVHLGGRVDRRSDVQIVAGLVRNLSGVVGVVNELTYGFDDTRSEFFASPFGTVPLGSR